MSTQIKKNGNWVTVAGGTRMWVGTKAALQAALDAGELVDGTAVMVTDDYEEGVQDVITVSLTPVEGITMLESNCYYTRCGNVVQFNIEFNCTQAFTNAVNTFGSNIFSGAADKFPKPKLQRNAANMSDWTNVAADATGYFYYTNNATYMSAAVGSHIINGTYICED